MNTTKVLFLSGTGTIGKGIISEIKDSKNIEIFCTSRQERISNENVHYIKGDSNDLNFAKSISSDFSIIIDTRHHQLQNYENLINNYLDKCDHFFFISTYRIFFNKGKTINENSPKITEYLRDSQLSEYQGYTYTKIIYEDFLKQSRKTNWTILNVVPIFGDNRLQFGALEKSDFIPRLREGMTIPVTRKILNNRTNLLYNKDFARIIIKMFQNKEAQTQSFLVASPLTYKWKKYKEIIENLFCAKVKIISSLDYQRINQDYLKYKYSRSINTSITIDKLINFLNIKEDFFTDPLAAYSEVLKKIKNDYINLEKNVIMDLIFNENLMVYEKSKTIQQSYLSLLNKNMID